MSKKETKHLEILSRLSAGEMRQKTAAELMGISTRWVREKLKRYRHEGIEGLLHKNRGRPSTRKLSEASINCLKMLVDEHLAGAGPTFCAEKMEELHNIKMSKESARKIMISCGQWEPKKQRVRHRKRRERKACVGMMTQLDGSEHDWFEGRADRCTLLVFVDDATSALLWLEFAPSESMAAVMKASKHYFQKHGLPQAFYTDYGSVFSVNTHNPERDKKTQFERALGELSVSIIHASSPQAKGRVERAHGTLQDRLVKELRLAHISSLEEANTFVQSHFLNTYNHKFAVKPAQQFDAHTPCKNIDLDAILCIKETRVVQNDFVVMYKTSLLQLDKQQKTLIRPKDHVLVSEHFDGTILLSIRKTELSFTKIDKRPEKITAQQPIKPTRYYKPAVNHPWRNYHAYTSPIPLPEKAE